MTTETLRIEMEDSGPNAGCCTIWLEQEGSAVVVLDRMLIERLETAIESVPMDARGLVLASSSERAFVAGADLKAIRDMSDPELYAYLAYASEVFAMLARLPMATAAAIGGAALGGGLELAMHCDGLIGAPRSKPYPIGLPEAGLHLCPGWGGSNLLPARVDPGEGIRRASSGKVFLFDEAVEHGLFDVVAPDGDSLLESARSWVVSRQCPAREDSVPSRWIGSPGRADAVRSALSAQRESLETTDPGRCVGDAIGAGLDSGWAEAVGVEQEHLVHLRSTPEAQNAIEAFFARSSRR